MHLVSAKQLDLDFVLSIFRRAQEIRGDAKATPKKIKIDRGLEATIIKNFGGKVLATLFYEPSTRTRLSFEAAMCRLGGKCISVENGRESSSQVKGESIEDTIKTISQYADVIVMRHPEVGSAERAAQYSDVPLINGGDGAGEHPTQALIDLYTIWRRKSLHGLKVVVFGSTGRARSIHSMSILLQSLFNDVEVQQVVNFETDDLKKVCECDVLYMTRIQHERFLLEEEKDKPLPVCLQKEILGCMKPDAMILHPLPRQEELPIEVDTDPRAAYWDQVKNGLYLRMALLERLLE